MTNDIRDITIDLYDYPLPQERIALHPLQQRDGCMLLVRQADGNIIDTRFSDIGRFLPDGARLVMNDTRVINARIRMRKGNNHDGALIEIFCLEPESPRDYAINFASTGKVVWQCMVGNSKRWKTGQLLTLPLSVGNESTLLSANRVAVTDNISSVEFSWDNRSLTFADIIKAVGEIPIPPYLNRQSQSCDNVDYQTVYSAIDGSVAAPTAGLHFTDSLLEQLASQGHPLNRVTLHVGAGTFQPVKSDTIGDHPMHAEYISVSRRFIADLITDKCPVIAIGTTSVRTLESLYHIGCMMAAGCWQGELPQWYPYNAEHPRLPVDESLQTIIDRLDNDNTDSLIASTRIIIAPGYRYRIVNGMVTNFHQPRSTLLLLVSAFVGEQWREIYNHALKQEDYRFLSYGDACLLLGNQSNE